MISSFAFLFEIKRHINFFNIACKNANDLKMNKFCKTTLKRAEQKNMLLKHSCKKHNFSSEENFLTFRFMNLCFGNAHVHEEVKHGRKSMPKIIR